MLRDSITRIRELIRVFRHEGRRRSHTARARPFRFCRNTVRLAQSNEDIKHIEIKKKKLHIHRTVAEDSGMYTCLAKNKAGSSPVADSYPLIVSGNETATIKVVPRNLIAKRGEPTALHCVFEDADDVQWFFGTNENPLETDDERKIFENGTLLIHGAEQRDQGFYSCHGSRNDVTVIYTVDLQIACEYCKKSFNHNSRQ